RACGAVVGTRPDRRGRDRDASSRRSRALLGGAESDALRRGTRRPRAHAASARRRGSLGARRPREGGPQRHRRGPRGGRRGLAAGLWRRRPEIREHLERRAIALRLGCRTVGVLPFPARHLVARVAVVAAPVAIDILAEVLEDVARATSRGLTVVDD